MKRRPLGATGITIGEIGLGAWQFANPDWGVYDKAEALRVVQQALDAGCDFFDTTPSYGTRLISGVIDDEAPLRLLKEGLAQGPTERRCYA
jgi:aryl-alcohol dehydrogenase-like predicted oxidoreductase